MADRHLLDVAYGRRPADRVITGGTLVNVLTGEVYPADVAISGTRIAAVGDLPDTLRGPGTEIIDARGRYLVPGLIDGHLHIECSKLSVTSFADLVVPFGTTSVVSGLDQILVVDGLPGVRRFLDESKNTGMRIWWGAPAKAPYTVPESTVGHTFGPEQHAEAHDWPECVGVWETVQEMVEHGDPAVMDALDLAERHRLPVFGCAPLSDARRISGLAAAGVRLDHESYSHEEMLEKLRLGIYAIVRESSVAHFLEENIQVVSKVGARRVAFCTDDVHAADVLAGGHMDKLVRMAVKAGVDPVTAIQMATINCAEMYRIDHLVGSIAPGRFADVLIVDSLDDFRVREVVAGGTPVARGGAMITPTAPPERGDVRPFPVREVTAADLALRAPEGASRVNVLTMNMTPEQVFVRKRRDVTLPASGGLVEPSVADDALLVTVVERYGKTGNMPVAMVSGMGLREGAIATSAAPDDNNIICVGASRSDMAVAINEVVRAGGGQVVVVDGEVKALLPLPVGGIVSDLPAAEMAAAETRLDDLARELGCTLPAPLMYLFFLSITAIPDYAITDLGLVDCVELTVIDPIISEA
ncbi:adenine deaminase [Microtetraspora sp. AC03309]|uniref:adenine deaminase C-terminal domain-containing protein n=1 Tax=Microtetraspora sp. AC03309 TaxID=2779376 RepID=UPI001E491A05|nr:adenine deaminase C-terminal domain-containing protein [Microtetraspora sp. AC03309]MCC5574847.1 adenine deaminase [Microtetraspora sp. AC03309]